MERYQMSYTKLPYDFDLLYDIKSVEELHRILNGEPHSMEIYRDKEIELCELMDHYKIPFPEGYTRPIAATPDIWIDGNGVYITYTPCEEEKHKWTPIFFKKDMRK
jgi:hypothetical protein